MEYGAHETRILLAIKFIKSDETIFLYEDRKIRVVGQIENGGF